MSTTKSGRRPAQIDAEQAAWPQEPEAVEKTAAEAAQADAITEAAGENGSAEAALAAAGPVIEAPEEPPTERPEELTADPWAVEKVSRVAAQKICLACPGHAERGDNGVWRVNVATLEHLGYSREMAERWIIAAQPHGCNPLWEGGVVVAKTATGLVSVRSTARRPHLTAYLALVREPSRLRCGDEVAVFCPPSGMREVCRGR